MFVSLLCISITTTQGDLVVLYRKAPSKDNPHLYENFLNRLKVKLGADQSEEKAELVREEIVEETPPHKKKQDAVADSAEKAASPLPDNPHHTLGIVEGEQSCTHRIYVQT